MKQVIGFVLGVSLSAGAIAAAAPGDLIYKETAPPVAVTAPQAATAADWFIARGAWDGDRADIDSCRVWRDTDSTYKAACSGLKTIAPGDVPASGGALNVVGRVE